MIHKLCEFIRQHGVSSYVENGTLYAMNVYTLNGEAFEEWVKLPATLKAVREWLGY